MCLWGCWFVHHFCQTEITQPPYLSIHAFIYLFTAVKVYIEMSVELHLTDAETLNLTLYGRNNHSSLHLHPPEEEEEKEVVEEKEEEKKKKKDDEGQRKAFYCCFPSLPSSESANQSRCLLWLTNLTVLTAIAKEKLPWERTQKGWCQDKSAVLLCSPSGQCGFTLSPERKWEETIKDKEIGYLVFILGEIDSVSLKPAFSLNPQWSHFFSIKRISLNSSSLDSSLSFVTLFPFLSLYCMIRELQFILIYCISKAALILACFLSIRLSNTPPSSNLQLSHIFQCVLKAGYPSNFHFLPLFYQTFPYPSFLFLFCSYVLLYLYLLLLSLFFPNFCLWYIFLWMDLFSHFTCSPLAHQLPPCLCIFLRWEFVFLCTSHDEKTFFSTKMVSRLTD